MADFDAINDELNRTEPAKVEISIVTLGGIQKQEVTEGMTIGQLKSRFGLEGTKVVDEDGDALDNNFVIDGDMELFVSTPKKNG